MSAAPPTKRTARPNRREHYKLGVSSYDRASSMLVSLLVIAGVTLLALLIIFFARRFVAVTVPPVILPMDPAERPADAAMGVAQDIEPPGLEDAPELDEPKLMDTLNALNALSSRQAVLSDENLDASDAASKGSGLGDNRTAGGGGGAPEPPRELRYQPADLQEYARFLDFFNFELAVGNTETNEVVYVTNLSESKATIRTAGAGEQDNRWSWIPTGPPLVGLNRTLLQKAGIAVGRQLVVPFVPLETERIIVGLEQQEATKAGKTFDQIKRTIFRVRPVGSGFEFSVIEQLYF